MKKEEIIIGTEVYYYPAILDDSTFTKKIKTTITSKPWKLGHGDYVCKIKGVSGGVSIKHLNKI